MRVRNGGHNANKSGCKLENQVCTALHDSGLEFLRHYKLSVRSIYGGEMRVDAFISNVSDFPDGLIVECKWQEKRGSAYEKLPYLVLNIKQCYPCPAVIVAAGKEHRNGKMRWLRGQVDGEKLLAVFTLEEFIAWTNKLS